MSYVLKLHRDVEKQLARMPTRERERVAAAMRSLRDDPRPPKCVRLEENLYRVRAGDYRIIYAVFDSELIVFLCKAPRRAEATYRDLQALLAQARREVE